VNPRVKKYKPTMVVCNQCGELFDRGWNPRVVYCRTCQGIKRKSPEKKLAQNFKFLLDRVFEGGMV